MRGSHWALVFLMIWGMCQFTETEKKNCPPPPERKPAKISAVQYVVGTTAVYTCDQGYKRQRGKISKLKCKNSTGYAAWQTEPDMCIVDPSKQLATDQPLKQPSKQPATEKGEGTSSNPQITAQLVMKDFCGIPRSPKHATLLKLNYSVGQKLNYTCQDGNQTQAPISEVSTCENLSGTVVWTSVTLSCTNDSSIAEAATTQLLATGWLHVPLVAVLFFLQ